MKASTRAHYSYSLYARPDVAQGFDTDRFGGPIGVMVAERQETVLLRMLGTEIAGKTFLDVGAGTGRASLALAREGGMVTASDASPAMMDVAREKAASLGFAMSFETADAQALPFSARSFDTVVCFRVLMHVPDWRKALGEICRVARRRVILDVPPSASLAALAPPFRRAMERLGLRDVQAYRTFRLSRLTEELGAEGFRVLEVHREFVVPLAVHRLIGSRRLSEGVEGIMTRLGLARRFGAPATILCGRQAEESDR
ncbi:MAG: class I SAM-dependent methyltransferase [Nitrospirota bacterium]